MKLDTPALLSACFTCCHLWRLCVLASISKNHLFKHSHQVACRKTSERLECIPLISFRRYKWLLLRQFQQNPINIFVRFKFFLCRLHLHGTQRPGNWELKYYGTEERCNFQRRGPSLVPVLFVTCLATLITASGHDRDPIPQVYYFSCKAEIICFG